MILVIIYLISFCIVWTLYTKYSKHIGLYVSVIAFFLVTIMPYIGDYHAPFMIKMHLVIFTSLCLFVGILYKCTRDIINPVITWLLRLNIGIMYFTNDNVFLKTLVLFIAFTTPYITMTDTGTTMRSFLVNKHVWILLFTITFASFYTLDVDFFTNNSYPIVLIALILPALLHFISNTFLESRAILLCMIVGFDLFNHNKNVLKTITDNL
jgi:hypothetical protein